MITVDNNMVLNKNNIIDVLNELSIRVDVDCRTDDANIPQMVVCNAFVIVMI